jgi:hypothetical protein
VDKGEGGPRGDAFLSDEPSVWLAPNGVELKAERRKPSGEKPCDIEDIPSLTGVLAHFRLHSFNAIRACPGGGETCSYFVFLKNAFENPELFVGEIPPLGFRQRAIQRASIIVQLNALIAQSAPSAAAD